MSSRLLAFAAFALLCCGCGKPPRKEPIALDQLPDVVIQTAKKEMRGVTLQRAVITPKGDYEIIGKDAKGKTHEIDISPRGVVTRRE